MSVFTKLEIAMITPDLDIKRYLNGDVVDIFRLWQMATLNYPNGYGHGTRVHNESVALTTRQQPIVKVQTKKKGKEKMRIRKLVPLECMKLMGFTKKDYQAMRDIGLTDSQIYHCAGDSIVVTVLSSILGQALPISEQELKEKIENYIDYEVVENGKIKESNKDIDL